MLVNRAPLCRHTVRRPCWRRSRGSRWALAPKVTSDQFRAIIRARLSASERLGKDHLEISAGELHRSEANEALRPGSLLPFKICLAHDNSANWDILD